MRGGVSQRLRPVGADLLGPSRLKGTRQAALEVGKRELQVHSGASHAGAEGGYAGSALSPPAQGQPPSRSKTYGRRRHGRERRRWIQETPPPPPPTRPGRELEGSAPQREGAGASGTKAIGPEPPAPPRHHLLGIYVGGSRRLGSGTGSGPAPPAYLLRWSRVLVSPKPPRAAKSQLSERPLDADGTAAMFAPRLLDFQKTKYAR